MKFIIFSGGKLHYPDPGWTTPRVAAKYTSSARLPYKIVVVMSSWTIPMFLAATILVIWYREWRRMHMSRYSQCLVFGWRPWQRDGLGVSIWCQFDGKSLSWSVVFSQGDRMSSGPCLVRHERFVFDFEGHALLVRFRAVDGVVVLVRLEGIVAVICHHSRHLIPLLLRNHATQWATGQANLVLVCFSRWFGSLVSVFTSLLVMLSIVVVVSFVDMLVEIGRLLWVGSFFASFITSVRWWCSLNVAWMLSFSVRLSGFQNRQADGAL